MWVLGVLLFVFAGILPPTPAAAEGPAMSGYRLNAGDKVRITVFNEPELSVTERLSDRGSISYPLLGELRVEGLTVDGLEALITQRLKGPYLVNPRVSVSIDEYREFFVMGQVNRPGSYAYVPGLTVRKAISIAGGFTERASRRRIYLVPEGAPQSERRVPQTDSVGPGDTVVVKESFF